MATVLQEFVIRIAAAYDRPSMQRALQQVQQGVQGQQHAVDTALDVLSRRVGDVFGNVMVRAISLPLQAAQAVFSAMTSIITRWSKTAVYAVGAVATNIGILAHRLDELQAVSERTGASVTNIRALDLAIRMIGGTSGDASGAIEGLANAMRENPGVRGVLRSLGVTELKDTVLMVEQLSAGLKGHTESTAIQFGGLMGLSPEIVRLLRDGRFAEQFREARQHMADVGVDQDKLARNARAFTNEWRKFLSYADLFNQALMGAFLGKEGEGGIFAKINKLIKDNAEPLARALAQFGGSVADFLDENAEKILEWLRDPKTPQRMVDAFKEMKNTVIQIKDAIVEIARVLTFLYDKFFGKDPMGMGALGNLWNDPRGTLGGLLGGGGGGAGTGNGGAEGMAGGAQGGGGFLSRVAKGFEGRPKFLGGTGEGIVKGFQSGGMQAGSSAGLNQTRVERARIINDELKAAGATDIGRAHVLSSMEQESGFRGTAQNSVAGGHTGLWQWDSTRWPKISSWIRQQGGDPSDVRWQTKAWVAEHTAKPGDPLYDGPKTARGGELMLGAKSAEDARRGVQLSERYGVGEEGGRFSNAPKWLGAVQDFEKTAAGPLKDVGRALIAGAKSFGIAAEAGPRPVSTTRYDPEGRPITFDRPDTERMKLTGQYGFSRANIMSSPSVNDNSKKVEFNPVYHTEINGGDPQKNATSFQRAHENLNDMGLRQLGGWSR